MKDEIKEIKLDHFKDLEELKQNVENWIATDEMYWERWFGLYDIKTLLDCITNLQEEIERLKKQETKWEKWSTEKSILSTKMSEYLCKWQNIKREYSNQIKCSTQRKRQLENYKSRNEKANTLLNEMLERAYIDGEYIMYDYSTSELLEVKQALQGEDKDV